MEIQGYEPLVGNSVHSRHTVMEDQEGRLIDTLDLIVIYSSMLATRNNVLEYIRSYAATALPVEYEHRASQKPNDLPSLIGKLPDYVLRDIINFGPSHDALEAAINEDQGTEYLSIYKGLIPEACRRMMGDEKWYLECLRSEEMEQYGFGVRWSSNIILPDSELPSPREILEPGEKNWLVENGPVDRYIVAQVCSMDPLEYDDIWDQSEEHLIDAAIGPVLKMLTILSGRQEKVNQYVREPETEEERWLHDAGMLEVKKMVNAMTLLNLEEVFSSMRDDNN